MLRYHGWDGIECNKVEVWSEELFFLWPTETAERPKTRLISTHKPEPEPSKRNSRGAATYTFTKRVYLFEVFPLVALFVLPSFVHAGVFSALAEMWSEEAEAEEIEFVENIQNVPLLKAALHSDPNPSKGGGDIIVEAGALVPENGPVGIAGEVVSKSSGEISVYVVREGDSLSQIAEMYDVSANTILWANDIKSADLIQPGDDLVILPITGVRHVVKSGDTLASIAKKYDGDVEDIMAYNGLTKEALSVGDTVVIPDGAMAAPAAPASRSYAAASGRGSGSSGEGSLGFSHPVPGSIKTQGIHGYNGVDFGAPAGTSIRAAAGGEVIIARASGWNGGYGKYIVIKHPNGTQTLYAHNSANYVVAGQSVAQGEVIGAVGSTGRSTGNHLHFEVRGARNPF